MSWSSSIVDTLAAARQVLIEAKSTGTIGAEFAYVRPFEQKLGCRHPDSHRVY